jgi:hypothetical protein
MMQHLLFIIALIVVLSACKDSVKEDSTPVPKQVPESKPNTYVTFESISVILDKSVVINGKVVSTEKNVREYGFVYSKTADFDLSSGTKVSFGSQPDSDVTSQVEGLEANTNYIGKLYLIKNNGEVIYSISKQFSTVASNTWQALQNPPIRSYNGTGFVIADTLYYVPGTIYAGGGERNLYAYDLVKNKWISKGELPFSPRVFSTSFSLNGRGYIMFGRLGDFSGNESTDDVWEYDAANNTWKQKANFPNKMHSAAGFLLNDKLYVTMGVLAGSQDIDKKIHEYDPVTDTWSTKPSVHPHPFFGAYGRGNSFVYNGKGYIYAGAYRSFPFSEYNPQTDTWTLDNSTVPGLEMPTGTYGALHPKSVLIKDKLFTSLGDSHNGRDMYQYNMVNKSWLKIGTYPSQFSDSDFLTNFKDKIFLVGNYNMYVFLPESN